ncbi:MAG: hypothetical protein DSZ23_05910 [Thermodesulfatator sp.]|nr:MAG: hypothetical protein DSZ23_05910 [Thermodesulfatator sp.]
MAKKCECPKGAPLWMVTFGDLMSLLLCFFVLLLSFSTTDPAMYKEVAGSLEKAFGVQKQEITLDIPKGIDIVSRDFNPVFSVDVILEKIKSAIKLELIKGEVQVEALKDRVVLRMNDQITFDPGSDQLREESKPILNKIRSIIETVPGEIMVTGHTDDSPVSGTFESNWHLSAARAASVVVYLLKNHSIDPSRMAAVGYGPSQPLVLNDTPEHMAKNRRVEIIFLQPRNPDNFDVRPLNSKGLLEQEPLPLE